MRVGMLPTLTFFVLSFQTRPLLPLFTKWVCPREFRLCVDVCAKVYIPLELIVQLHKPYFMMLMFLLQEASLLEWAGFFSQYLKVKTWGLSSLPDTCYLMFGCNLLLAAATTFFFLFKIERKVIAAHLPLRSTRTILYMRSIIMVIPFIIISKSWFHAAPFIFKSVHRETWVDKLSFCSDKWLAFYVWNHVSKTLEMGIELELVK